MVNTLIVMVDGEHSSDNSILYSNILLRKAIFFCLLLLMLRSGYITLCTTYQFTMLHCYIWHYWLIKFKWHRTLLPANPCWYENYGQLGNTRQFYNSQNVHIHRSQSHCCISTMALPPSISCTQRRLIDLLSHKSFLFRRII